MLQYMWTLASRLRDREEGQTLVEYGLIVALVSIAVVAALTTMGTELDRLFDAVATALTGAEPAGGDGGTGGTGGTETP